MGAIWSRLARKAPRAIAGQTRGPKRSTAAMARPVGIQTAVALVPGAASRKQSAAEAT
jgi:hypothetical protein